MEIPIEQLAKKLNATVDETVRAIKIELFNGVIRDTRVDTGRLRGNWQTTTGSPAGSSLLRKDQIAQGEDGGKAQTEVAETVRADTVDYLSNNLPYAEVWEEKDSMISGNMARLERIIKEAVND